MKNINLYIFTNILLILVLFNALAMKYPRLQKLPYKIGVKITFGNVSLKFKKIIKQIIHGTMENKIDIIFPNVTNFFIVLSFFLLLLNLFSIFFSPFYLDFKRCQQI